MKILMQSRGTLLTVPGGDTVQIIKTADALRARGHLVDLSLEIRPKVRGYDLVHVFNLMRPQETAYQAQNAKQQGVPVALSTIFGPYIDGDRHNRTGVQGFVSRHLTHSQVEYLKIVARGVMNFEFHEGILKILLQGYHSAQESLIENVDVLLPNSITESLRVADYFPKAKDRRTVVVPNAIDQSIFHPAPLASQIDEPFVLCVARIESRKSQVVLAKAATEVGLPLVIVGKSSPNSKAYFSELLAIAKRNPRIRILDHVAHESLPALYRSCRVHALVSWMESPGLSSLEAAACGANVVLTPMGDTREYFGDFGYYCHPANLSSVCDALERAWNAAPNPALADHILNHFTWEAAAEATLAGYTQVVL